MCCASEPFHIRKICKNNKNRHKFTTLSEVLAASWTSFHSALKATPHQFIAHKRLIMSHGIPSKHSEDIAQAVLKIDCSEPSLVIQGLNVVTKKSFESLESNSLQLENFPQLAISLGCLLEVIDPLTSFVFFNAKTDILYGLQLDNPPTPWVPKLITAGNLKLKVLLHTIFNL